MTHPIDAAAKEIAAASSTVRFADASDREHIEQAVVNVVRPILERHFGYGDGVPTEPGEFWWARHPRNTASEWVVLKTRRSPSGESLLAESARHFLHVESASQYEWEFRGPIPTP